jgi:hypothetical protein
MKKIKITVYALIFCVQALLSAEHPDGLGLGLAGGGGYTGGVGLGSIAVPFKIPKLPVFWELDFRVSSVFHIGLNGDYYILDRTIVSALDLGWYLGAGLHIGLALSGGEAAFSSAVRLPIGLTWRLESTPSIQNVDSLELFLEFIPSVGFLVYNDTGWNYSLDGKLGVRLWVE